MVVLTEEQILEAYDAGIIDEGFLNFISNKAKKFGNFLNDKADKLEDYSDKESLKDRTKQLQNDYVKNEKTDVNSNLFKAKNTAFGAKREAEEGEKKYNEDVKKYNSNILNYILEIQKALAGYKKDRNLQKMISLITKNALGLNKLKNNPVSDNEKKDLAEAARQAEIALKKEMAVLELGKQQIANNFNDKQQEVLQNLKGKTDKEKQEILKGLNFNVDHDKASADYDKTTNSSVETYFNY